MNTRNSDSVLRTARRARSAWAWASPRSSSLASQRLTRIGPGGA